MARRTLLTQGNVVAALVKFSIPFLLANLLQAFYGAADLLIVGQFSDSIGVCAVAIGSQVMQTVTGIAIGLAAGGTVMIGQHFGAEQGRELADTAATILCVFFLFSILMTAFMVTFLQPICHLMQVPIEALLETKKYLLICSGGIVFIVGYNAVAGILRGLGDSRTPLYFVAVSCGVNVILDLLLVAHYHFGAAGAAVATVVAQAAGLLLAFILLCYRGFVIKYKRSNARFRLCAARQIFGVGLPVAMQEGFINFSFLMITAIVNRLGLTAAAAVGVVEKLIMFSMLPTTAFACAISAMTAQHIGAGLIRRSRVCLRTGIGLSLIFGIACFACAQIIPEACIRLFCREPAIVAAGVLYLRSYSLDCVVVCFVFCMNAYFSGCGKSLFPLLHSILATFLVRVPLSFVLSQAGLSLFFVGYAAPAASFLSLLLCFFYEKRLFLNRQKIALS